MAADARKLRRANNKPSEKPDIWPWWQLGINNDGNYFKGRDRVELSHHVINLRPKKETNNSQLQTDDNYKTDQRLSTVNFLNLVKPTAYSLSKVIDYVYGHWYRARDLSLFFVLEILITIADILWLACLVFFLKLHQETRVLSQSVWLDISAYFTAVGLVISWPFSLFKFKARPRVSINQTRIKPLDLQPKTLFAQTGIFVVLVLVLILPLKGVATWQSLNYRSQEVINLASNGFLGLEQAGSLLSQGDPELAQKQLANSTESFNQAVLIVNNLSDQLAGLLGRLPVAGSKLETAKSILLASQEVTEAAGIVADTLKNLNSIADEQTFAFGTSLNILNKAAAELQPHLNAATEYLYQAEGADLPTELSEVLKNLQGQLAELEVNIASVLSLPQLLQQVLVSAEPRTYAVIFQNTSELRPTGGFAGSLALIEFEQGEVRSINIPGGGPYDFQGSLTKIVRPPEPLRLVRGTWQLQDANWFYDFPSSAEKIRWFLMESGGPEIDGVIALNSDVVVQLLKMTGPVELPQYGKVLTADNFMRETQAAVELEYDREENRPKQFIADLAPVLFSRLLSFKGQEMINLSALINSSLLNKGIQLYSVDPQVETSFQQFGWGGQVEHTAGDYLAVVRTNIGGGKTDNVIHEQIHHQLEISPTGELTARLTISRSHLGDSRDTFESRRNVSYIRFYVPSGSTLLATEGFTPPPTNYYRAVPAEAGTDDDLNRLEIEKGWDTSSGTRITEEYGKTVFGNWLSVSPGTTAQASIVYRLPFRLEPGATWQDLRRYSIFFQRQSGVAPLDFSSEIIWPESFRLRWQESSQQPFLDHNRFEMRSDWQGDDFYGLIFEKI